MNNPSIENIYKKIGLNIKRARERKNPYVTQEKLSKSIKMSRTSIVNIEQGYQRVLLHTLYEIASFLNIHISELLPDINENETIEIIKSSNNLSMESVNKAISSIR